MDEQHETAQGPPTSAGLYDRERRRLLRRHKDRTQHTGMVDELETMLMLIATQVEGVRTVAQMHESRMNRLQEEQGAARLTITALSDQIGAVHAAVREHIEASAVQDKQLTALLVNVAAVREHQQGERARDQVLGAIERRQQQLVYPLLVAVIGALSVYMVGTFTGLESDASHGLAGAVLVGAILIWIFFTFRPDMHAVAEQDP